jgi:hypothetical protein
MTEVLYFWHPAENLIPVLIDCVPSDLARPRGEYEQLPDIVAPFVAAREPLFIAASTF